MVSSKLDLWWIFSLSLPYGSNLNPNKHDRRSLSSNKEFKEIREVREFSDFLPKLINLLNFTTFRTAHFVVRAG